VTRAVSAHLLTTPACTRSQLVRAVPRKIKEIPGNDLDCLKLVLRPASPRGSTVRELCPAPLLLLPYRRVGEPP